MESTQRSRSRLESRPRPNNEPLAPPPEGGATGDSSTRHDSASVSVSIGRKKFLRVISRPQLEWNLQQQKPDCRKSFKNTIHPLRGINESISCSSYWNCLLPFQFFLFVSLFLQCLNLPNLIYLWECIFIHLYFLFLYYFPFVAVLLRFMIIIIIIIPIRSFPVMSCFGH